MDYKIITEIFKKQNTVAIVGFSDNRTRPSNRIGRYLHGNGFKVYGVNPKLANSKVDEIVCFGTLNELPSKADIINIFRRSEFLFDLMKEILSLKFKPDVIWTQVGVICYDSKKLAESNGLIYIENRCIMTEHQKSF